MADLPTPTVRYHPQGYTRTECEQIDALGRRMRDILHELDGTEHPTDTFIVVPSWFATRAGIGDQWFWSREAATQYAAVLAQYNIPCTLHIPE